jgi:hypothetical protein
MILLLGTLTTETVIAQVGCPGKNISQFTTSSPIGLLQSAITNPSTGRIIEPFFKYHYVFLQVSTRLHLNLHRLPISMDHKAFVLQQLTIPMYNLIHGVSHF